MRSAVPPQAPQRGGLARWLGPLHITGSVWFRLLCFGAKVVPERPKRFLLPIFTLVFSACLGGVRRAIGDNLQVVMGACGFWERQRRVFRTLKTFAWCMTERYERLATDRRVEVTAEGEEHWKQIMASGDGVILMTAHIGHWEVGSMVAPTRERRHVHIVREEEMDPRAQEFLQKLFEEQGDDQGFTMHFAKDDPMLGVKLHRSLQAGDVVAVQGDRPRSTGGALTTEMFGRPMDLPKGPAALARSSGCPILPVFVYRAGRLRSRVVFQEPIFVPPTDDRRGDIEIAVRRMAQSVESAIRRHPTQWFCFRSLWPDAK